MQLERVLATADTWRFDAYALEEASNGHPLSTLGFWLFHRTSCMDYASMDASTLARFLRKIESGYKSNPYHNSRHAADVLQTLHMIMHQGGLVPGYVDQLTMLGCYLAAIVHDYEHLGRTNDYLVNTTDRLAVRYNGGSCRMHAICMSRRFACPGIGRMVAAQWHAQMLVCMS